MSLLNEVIQDSIKKRTSFHPISKADYEAQRKNEETIWASIDQQTDVVFSSNEELYHFLKAQARLHYMSANNILFLQTQRSFESPDLSMLRSFDQWNGMGRRIRKSEKHLKILDGYGRSFKTKQVYDISQTTGSAVNSDRTLAQDQAVMLAAMISAAHNKRIGINIDNLVPAEIGGSFNDGVISLRDDLPLEKTIFGLALASIAAERDPSYRRSSSIEICSAIIFCEAAGIPVEHDDSLDLLLSIVNMDSQDLTEVRERRRILEYSQKTAKVIYEEIGAEVAQIRSAQKDHEISPISHAEQIEANSKMEAEKSKIINLLQELMAPCKDVIPNHSGYIDDSWLNYLSRDEAVVALRYGVPIGVRGKYPDYHGSHKGDYRYNPIPTETMLDTHLSSRIEEDRASIHYALPKDIQEKVKSYLNQIVELEADAPTPQKQSAPQQIQMENTRKEREYAMEM